MDAPGENFRLLAADMQEDGLPDLADPEAQRFYDPYIADADLIIVDRAWDHSTFSKNRERLLEGDIAAKLLSAMMAQQRVKRLLSFDHFSVDSTLIEGASP
jgi:hypothetical protein